MSKAKLRKYREWNYLQIALHFVKIRNTYNWYQCISNTYNKSKDWDKSILVAENLYDSIFIDTTPKFWIDNYGSYRNALKYACEHYYSELITLENILRYTQFKNIESDIRNIKGIGEKYVECYE